VPALETDKADVEIVSRGGESPDGILPGRPTSTITRCSTPKRLAKFNAYFLKQVSRRATRTMLIPESRDLPRNSLPIPDEAP